MELGGKEEYGSVISSGISFFEILNSYIFLPSIVFLTIHASRCHSSPPLLSLFLSEEKIIDGSNFASNVPYLSVNLKRLNGPSREQIIRFSCCCCGCCKWYIKPKLQGLLNQSDRVLDYHPNRSTSLSRQHHEKTNSI